MGGCCCSARKSHLHGTPMYYYCPPGLEGHETLTSQGGIPETITAGLLVHMNLETSTPDTYRSPPTPLPYDVILGCQQLTESESVKETTSGGSFETVATFDDLDESECKSQISSLVSSPRKLKSSKSNKPDVSAEEEDGCPICLEVYDEENPKLITKCEHDFHLSCILEWMERSDTCPICDQEMVFDTT